LILLPLSLRSNPSTQPFFSQLIAFALGPYVGPRCHLVQTSYHGGARNVRRSGQAESFEEEESQFGGFVREQHIFLSCFGRRTVEQT
jgi:hypothetical protein